MKNAHRALCALMAAACLPLAGQAAPETKVSAARCKYLVATSACMDCHTPLKMGPKGPEPDMSRLLSGHPETVAIPAPPKASGPWNAAALETMTAWSGPWGVSFTANLTPDPETGLGKWTERDFVQTIRTGRHMGKGRAILPPMPVPVYNNFSDADLRSIFLYLKTLPPIKNKVPEPIAPAGTAPAR